MPKFVKGGALDTGSFSNIRPSDYVGAESCKRCHSDNYNDWFEHSHRLMNATATPEHVKGDFSGDSEEEDMQYLGGTVSCYREDSTYFMRFKRGGAERIFRISRTIGSRFFQYYTGRLTEGSERSPSPLHDVEHVLPVGYWMAEDKWVPAIHVQGDDTDNDVWDPFSYQQVTSYDLYCASCHTTLSAGDWMLRSGGRKRMTQYTPREVSFQFSEYIANEHPALFKADDQYQDASHQQVFNAMTAINDLPTQAHAASLGISCEACHHGCKEHVAASSDNKADILPAFFPVSSNLATKSSHWEELRGRNPKNVNFACSKCHVGRRPQYANGTHTWNSTEFADAVRGSCYDSHRTEDATMSTLTCIHCHDPHQGIGQQWPKQPDEDNASCLSCHQEFASLSARVAHTHHPADSRGSDCMNCHMPKINEGLQAMVRTHRIFSPTDPKMIESNHPNACNLCHLDKPIDWTLNHLSDWYLHEAYPGNQSGARKSAFSETAIAEHYPVRDRPVGQGWLYSPHPPTRLAAVEALSKHRAYWALDDMLTILVDSHMINRQFAQKGVEEMLQLDLEGMGYRYYLAPAERHHVVSRIRPLLLERAAAIKQGNN